MKPIVYKNTDHPRYSIHEEENLPLRKTGSHPGILDKRNETRPQEGVEP
jgi:hypothetical protein